MKNRVELDRSRMLGFRLVNKPAIGSKVGSKTLQLPAMIGSKVGSKVA